MADTFQVQLERLDGYRFRADFGEPAIPPLMVDEGPPLGQNSGPNPSRLLATALADCLSASLVFCLSRSSIEVGNLATTATGTYVRNERNRLRIGRIDVVLVPELPGAERAKVQKCLELFEDFCVVTASVRKGLPVGVRVVDASGATLYARTEG
jgi:organic hydroperoxide reductase OsmC/OhrA